MDGLVPQETTGDLDVSVLAWQIDYLRAQRGLAGEEAGDHH